MRVSLIIIFLCLLFGTSNVKSVPNLDSLEKSLLTAEGEYKLFALAELAWYYRNIKPSKAIAFAQEGLALSKADSLLNFQTEFNASIGANFIIIGNFDKAIVYYQQAIKNAALLNDSLSIASYMNNIGVAYRGKSLLDSALFYYKNSLEIYKSQYQPHKAASSYVNIASIYESLEQTDKAYEYYNRALKIRIESDDTLGMATIYNNLSLIYQQNEEFQKAENILFKTLKLSRAAGDSNGVATALVNIGRNFELQNKYQEALEYYLRTLPKVKEIEDLMILVDLYNYIGSVYVKLENYPKAIEFISKSLRLSKEKSMYEGIEASYQVLHSLYSTVRDYKKAYKYSLLFKEAHDSLNKKEYHNKLASEIAQSTAELQVKLEVEKQNNEILRLEQDKEDQHTYSTYLLIIAFILLAFVVSIFILFRTIKTNHKNLTKAYLDLKDRDEKLRELLALKDKFFRIIAHDLKTPLGIFMNLSDYILTHHKEMSNDDMDLFLEDMKKTSKQLNSLLDNLLLWSKVQTGMLKVQKEKFDLSILTNRLFSEIEQLSKDKKQKFTTDTNGQLYVYADLSMIYTILKNLIINAIKYTPDKGEIKISTHRDGRNAVFTVVDSGVGIAPDRIDRIYSYHRDKTYGTNNEPGTGIGLVLSKELADLNNGKFYVQSEIDKGSTFTFTLPLAENSE